MVIADCRSLSRIGGILLTALTLCFVGSVQPASAQSLFEIAVRRRLPPACAGADAAAGECLRRSVRHVRRRAAAAERRCRLRPRHRLLRADLRRPLFPAAAPCRREPGRTVQIVLSGGEDHGVLRQQDRHRGGAKRHALCRSRQCLRLSRQGQSTTAPATARTGSASRASSPPAIRRCGRATSSPPTTALRPTRGRNRTAEFTPIGTSSSEWARRLSEVKVRPAPPSEKIEPVGQ